MAFRNGEWMSDGLRRTALRVFLVSIAANAALGIWALLSSDFGQTEGKVLATSLLVSAAVLSVLVNVAPLQRRVVWPVPAVAAVVGAGSILAFIVMIWAETDDATPLRAAFSGLVIAVAATLSGLLALLPLQPGHEPIRYLHHALTVLLTATIIWGIWTDPGGSWFGRTLGVQSILVAALTVGIPVLGRFGRGADRTADRIAVATAADVAPSKVRTVDGLVLVEPVSIAPSDSLRSAVARLIDNGTSFLVVEDSRSVAGVISEHDIVRAINDGAELDETTVGETMSMGVITADPDTSVDGAAQLLVDHHVRHLLVLGDRSGVLSVHDILAALAGSR